MAYIFRHSILIYSGMLILTCYSNILLRHSIWHRPLRSGARGQCTLRSGVCGWGKAEGRTEVMIKPRDPHLAGGENMHRTS